MEKELDKNSHQIFRIFSLTKYPSLQVNEVANFQGVPEIRDQNCIGIRNQNGTV